MLNNTRPFESQSFPQLQQVPMSQGFQLFQPLNVTKLRDQPQNNPQCIQNIDFLNTIININPERGVTSNRGFQTGPYACQNFQTTQQMQFPTIQNTTYQASQGFSQLPFNKISSTQNQFLNSTQNSQIPHLNLFASFNFNNNQFTGNHYNNNIGNSAQQAQKYQSYGLPQFQDQSQQLYTNSFPLVQQESLYCQAQQRQNDPIINQFQQSTTLQPSIHPNDIEIQYNNFLNMNFQNNSQRIVQNQVCECSTDTCEEQLNLKKNEICEALSHFKSGTDIALWSKLKNTQSKSIRGSRFRGISKNGKKWQVQLLGKFRKRYIGSIKSEVIAAQIYDHYAIITHGLKAKTNFTYTKYDILDILSKFTREDLINPSQHIIKLI